MTTDDGTFHLDPDDSELTERLETLRDFVLDFQDSDMTEDDAVATFFVNAGRIQMYKRLRSDGVIEAGFNPTLESRMELSDDDEDIHFYQ